MLKLMVIVQQALQSVKNQKGAVAIEYGLLVALIALLIGVGMTGMENAINAWFTRIATAIAALTP